MYIEYETNLDNIVEAYYRYHERSAASRKMRYIATFWAGSVTGVVVFMMFSLVGVPLLARFILAVCGIVFAAGGYSLDNVFGTC